MISLQFFFSSHWVEGQLTADHKKTLVRYQLNNHKACHNSTLVSWPEKHTVCVMNVSVIRFKKDTVQKHIFTLQRETGEFSNSNI